MDMVATEYGVAYLMGKTIRERAQELIDIAHPDDRDKLVKQAKEAKILLLGDMWETLEILYQKCEEYISINESIITKSEGALRRKIAGMMFLIVIPSIAVIISIGLMFLLLTRKILASVEDIAVTARNINLKDLSGRVNTDSLEEELDYLAKSINAMLDRLERSFEYVKEFSSSIGHELKTPLAIIKGGSEIALRKERQADEYKKALRVNIEESNRMIQIVEDLFSWRSSIIILTI